MRKILIFMLAVFLTVPNIVAFNLWKQAKQTGKNGELVAADQAGFQASAPFVAVGKLHSPSGAGIKSKQLQKDCLTYETKVLYCQTVTNSEGEDEDRSEKVFEERDQVPDLRVVFDGGEAGLDAHKVSEFYQPKTVELDDFPQYVPFEPDISNPRHWYSVSEAAYVEGQTVTVVGTVGLDGALAEHPGVKELIVFPGGKDELLAHLADSSKTYRIIALAMVGMSVVGVLVCGLILKMFGAGGKS